MTSYDYDDFGNLSSVTNAKSEITNYTYDLCGNMLTQTDARGIVLSFEYNAANKPVKRIDSGGRSGLPGSYTYDLNKLESYTYNPDGSMAIKTDRNGVDTEYAYDIHGRMTSQVADSQSISYTYDNNGNQLMMTDSTGTTTRTYDALGRVLTKAVPNIGTTTFVYDITTGMSPGFTAETTTDPKSNVTQKIYDKTGRMTSVVNGSMTTTYSYYNDGSKHLTTYAGGATEEYTYTPDNLLYTLVNRKADLSLIDSYTYTYDDAHNMLTKVDAKGTTSYLYDELNRLSQVTESGGRVTAYTFDASGNRATQIVTLSGNVTLTTYAYDLQNRLTGTVTTLNGTPVKTDTYLYDYNGNQTRLTSVSGATSITNTSYDNFNQMIQTVLPDSSVLTYAYNGEGKRIEKTADGLTTRYLFEGDKIILELDGAGNTSAVNIQGTSLISRTTGGQTAFYMYNGHGDATALLSPAGAILGTYYFDAFGTLTETTGTFDNPFTYGGYQYDEETGLYYLQSRMYDSTIARFLQEDTYRGQANDPLSLNYYTYCHNEPLMYSDPLGYADVNVRAVNESQGNTVSYSSGTSAGSSTITITTPGGQSKKLTEGKDYKIGSDGKAVYINNSSSSVRTSSESNGNLVSFSSGSGSGNSIINISGNNSNTTLREGTDYYIGNDGKAYYYSNIRSTYGSQGYNVSYTSSGSQGSSSISLSKPSSPYGISLREGTDYYIGADGLAHNFIGPPSPGPVVVKSTTQVNSNGTYNSNNFWEDRQDTWICPIANADYDNLGKFGTYREDKSGNPRTHAGIDFHADPGTQVVAMTDGVVIRISDNFYQGLASVEVRNSDGTIARYTEINASVVEGQSLKQGDVLGTVEINMNNHPDSMLHLEIYDGSGGYDLVKNPLSQTSNHKYNTAPTPQYGTYQRRSDLIDPTGASKLKPKK